MNFEPEKFFIGVIDLFSVLLPGALLTYLLMNQIGAFFLGADIYYQLSGAAAWIAFFFSSYLFGHFIFLIGAAFLDDWVYDRLRSATYTQQIRRLADGRTLSWRITRRLAHFLMKDASDMREFSFHLNDVQFP